MLTWFAVTPALGAVAVGARWWLPRPDGSPEQWTLIKMSGWPMPPGLRRPGLSCSIRRRRHQPPRSVVMLGAVLLGLVTGVVARMLVPGDVLRNMSGPTSWLASLAVGLAGAILGYLIFTVVLGIGDTDIFDWGGILSAIIGTVIVLLVVGVLSPPPVLPRVAAP